MSQKIAPPPPPAPRPPPAEVESWLAELQHLTQQYQNHRADERRGQADLDRVKALVEESRARADDTVKKIAVLMRQRCGAAFLAGLAAEGADDLERRTMEQLDGVDPDDDRWTTDVGDEGGINPWDPDREQRPDVD